MAGPTQTEAQTLNLLTGIKDQLTKLNNSQKAGKASRTTQLNKERKKSANENDLSKMSAGAQSFTKRLNEADKQFVEANKATKSFGKQLSDTVKDAILPGRNMFKQAMKDFNDSLSMSVKNRADEYRNMSSATQTLLKNNKDATSVIKDSVSAFRGAAQALRNVSVSGQKYTIQEHAHILAMVDTAHKLTTATGGAVNVLHDNIKKSAAQSAAWSKLTSGLEINNKELSLLSPVLKQVRSNLDAVSGTVGEFAKSASDAATTMSKGIGDAAKQIISGIKQIVLVAGRQVYEDLKAQARNAVGESQYKQAGLMGVSEAQLAGFQGQNRLALRAMGGGNSSAAIANGSINQLQTKALNMGLSPEESLKFMGGTFDNLMRVGLTPSVENASKQMDMLYKTMQQTGASFEEINEMVADLSKSPAFLQLAQANGYKGQEEQIHLLATMVKSQGYSTSYLKDLLELNKNQQYQGIEEAVKGMVGLRLLGGRVLGSDANKQLQNPLNNEDMGLLSELKARGAGGLEQSYNNGNYNNTRYRGQKVTDRFKTSGELLRYALQRQSDFNKVTQQKQAADAGSADLYGGLVDKTLINTFGQIAGPEYQQHDAAAGAMANLQSLTGGINPNQSQTANMLGANDALIKSINDVRNEFIPFGDVMNKFVIKFGALLEGVGKNPIGQAGGAVFGVTQGIANLALGGLALRGLGSSIPAIARIGGIGGALSGMGGGLAALGGGGLAGAGLVGGSALTAGAGGYLLGTGIDNIPRMFGGSKISEGLGGMMNDWFGPTVHNTEVSHIIRRKNALGAPNTPSTSINSDILNPITDTPANPQGDTAGELFTKMTSLLSTLNASSLKQIELLQSTHDEYMDFLTQSDLLDKVNQGRANAGRNMVR